MQRQGILLIVLASLLTQIIANLLPQQQIPHSSYQIFSVSSQPFTLPPPSTLTRLLRLTIQPLHESIHCSNLPPQPYPHTTLRYAYPSYRPFSENQHQWQTQIVSACVSYSKGGVWVMLSDGDLVRVEEREMWRKQWEEVERYGVEGGRKGWVQGRVYELGGKVVMWEGYALKELELVKGHWRYRTNLIEGRILQIVQLKLNNAQALLVLTANALYKIDASLHPSNIKIQPTPPYKHMATTQTHLFLLTGASIVTFQLSSMEIFQQVSRQEIEQGEWAIGLAVSEECIVVHFQRRKEHVVREYKRKSDREIEAGIMHRNVEKPRKMLIFDKIAVIFQNYQLLIFQLDFPFEDQLNGNYRKIRSEQLQHIEQIDKKQLKILMVSAGEVQAVTIQNLTPQFGIFGSALKCSSQETGENQVTVLYKGVCRNDSSKICEEVVDYRVSTEQNQNNVIFKSVQIGILAALLAVMVILMGGFLWQRGRLRRQIEQKQNLINKRKVISENSIVQQDISITFSPAKQKMVKTQQQQQ